MPCEIWMSAPNVAVDRYSYSDTEDTENKDVEEDVGAELFHEFY